MSQGRLAFQVLALHTQKYEFTCYVTGARPLNSALEVDLDFERAVRPPPQPTEEITASLEDLIRARIAEHNFDDVPRVAPPVPETRTKTIDMDDKKSGKVRSHVLVLPM